MPRPFPVRPGRHLCAVASTVDAQGRLAARWIRDSLEAGLRVVWVERPGGSIHEWLTREGVAWEEAAASGGLEVIPPRDLLYLRAAADIPNRLQAGRDLVEHALEQGYAGVSLGVESSDALSVMPDVSTWLAFEVAWEKFTRTHPLWLLCLYGPTAEPTHIDAAVPLHPREFADPLVSASIVAGRIRMSGEVDLLNSELIQAYLCAAAADSEVGSGDVVLDLTGLRFIDCCGVRGLLELQRRQTDRRVRLRNVPPGMRLVLDVTGWAAELDVEKAFR